jgi:hypothetical protein
MNSLKVTIEPTHPMASSNTKDNNIFRLANGNYISRTAYVFMVADNSLISHRYLTPSESLWAMNNRKAN